MYKTLASYCLIFSFLFSGDYQSIHQQQLEYYNANYVMPEYGDNNLRSIQYFLEIEIPQKRFSDITLTGWGRHGQIIILI